MEGLEARSRVGLPTRELVTPAKDSTTGRNFKASNQTQNHKPRFGGDLNLLNGNGRPIQLVAGFRRNGSTRLIYGEQFCWRWPLCSPGDAETPSLRGKIDLIYIDPPFDSKADYRTKITLAGGDVEQKPTVIEQFAYSDPWADGAGKFSADGCTALVSHASELLSRKRFNRHST